MSRLSLAPLALMGAAAGLILAGCGGGSDSPSPAVTQRVTGFIYNTETALPVAGATVRVQGTNVTAITAADGSYTIGPLNPARAYDMTISLTGYVDSAAKILTRSNTLQAPQVYLTPANPAVTITNATGGTVDSNGTVEGNTARVDVPANALPNGVASASVGATLMVGTAVPGAASTNSQTIYPAVNLALGGTTGSFAQPVTLTFPLPFAMTVGATVPVHRLGTNGQWASAGANATVLAGGETASFTTVQPGTYGLALPINATATVVGTPNRTILPGPYTDPVTYPLTGATINWSTSDPDGRDALDSAFVQSQRQGDINVPGDLDATQLVIHPRGTSQIVIVRSNLSVSVQATGVTIQQTPAATGDVEDLASYEIVAHQQGSGSAN